MIGGRFRIRAGNRIAERQQDFGDAAHADPADADEMNALEIVKRHHHEFREPTTLFDQVHDILHGVRLRETARVGRHRLQFGGLVEQTKNFLRKTFRGELGLRDQPRRAGALHFLGVAQLVAVGGGAEGDEDGGASGGGDFRGRDGARAADDQIGLGKSLRHVPDEGQYLRVDFTPRIRHAHSIIVAFAGLVNDGDAIFLRGQQIRGVHQRAVDDQRALAASGDQDDETVRRARAAGSRKIPGAREFR